MTAKGCLMPVSNSPNSAAQEVPNEFLEEASAFLYDAAGLALYAAAPAKFTVFEYAVLQSGVLEALRLAAPQEFAAYMAAPADSEAEVDAFRALATAAPDELAAASTISNTLESISNALDSSK